MVEHRQRWEHAEALRAGSGAESVSHAARVGFPRTMLDQHNCRRLSDGEALQPHSTCPMTVASCRRDSHCLAARSSTCQQHQLRWCTELSCPSPHEDGFELHTWSVLLPAAAPTPCALLFTAAAMCCSCSGVLAVTMPASRRASCSRLQADSLAADGMWQFIIAPTRVHPTSTQLCCKQRQDGRPDGPAGPTLGQAASVVADAAATSSA